MKAIKTSPARLVAGLGLSDDVWLGPWSLQIEKKTPRWEACSLPEATSSSLVAFNVFATECFGQDVPEG